jgi:hypothetical protein
VLGSHPIGYTDGLQVLLLRLLIGDSGGRPLVQLLNTFWGLEDLLGALRSLYFFKGIRIQHSAFCSDIIIRTLHPHTACDTVCTSYMASGLLPPHRIGIGVSCVLPICPVAVVRFNIDFFSNNMSGSLIHNREKRLHTLSRRAREALEEEETLRPQLRRLLPAPTPAPRHSSDVQHATLAPSTAAHEVDLMTTTNMFAHCLGGHVMR